MAKDSYLAKQRLRRLAVVPLRAGVVGLDKLLSRLLRVEDFSSEPNCILRLSLRGNRRNLVLELHFNNKQLPLLKESGADFAWGTEFMSRLVYSLRLLARYINSRPNLQEFSFLHAELGFLRAQDVPKLEKTARRFGFVLEFERAPGYKFWTRGFWANLYSWWLMWAYNPATLKGKKFAHMCRSHLWMTRETFFELYSSPACGSLPVPEKERRLTVEK